MPAGLEIKESGVLEMMRIYWENMTGFFSIQKEKRIIRDFNNLDQFGIRAITPHTLLEEMK